MYLFFVNWVLLTSIIIIIDELLLTVEESAFTVLFTISIEFNIVTHWTFNELYKLVVPLTLKELNKLVFQVH